MSSKIPRGVILPTETKKNGHKLQFKAAAGSIMAQNAAHKSDGNLKAPKENAPRKNFAPKVHKGVSTRYGQPAELKENQHPTAANEELQKKLSETQQRVTELELQLSELEKENEEVHKNLQDCHIVLVSAKIDPVLGERVGDAARQNEEQRKEVMSVSTELLRELKAFGDVASQQRSQLEEIQTTMVDLTKARDLMKQERENFSQQLAEMEQALTEAEELLL